jgi:hypothetical protein
MFLQRMFILCLLVFSFIVLHGIKARLIGSIEIEEQVCTTCMSFTQTSEVWYIDSGASSHMIGHKHYFNNLSEKEFGFEILLGDDYAYHPKGVGIVRFERESGKPLYLSSVLYVPGLKKKLVLVLTLEDKGYEVSFKDRRAYIKPRGLSKGSEQVIGVRKEKLYKLQFDSHYTLASNNSTRDCELWHMRVAHLGHSALKILGKIMTRMSLVTSEHHEICKGCVLGKYVQAHLPKSESRSKSILDLIHIDICGPMSSLSI